VIEMHKYHPNHNSIEKNNLVEVIKQIKQQTDIEGIFEAEIIWQRRMKDINKNSLFFGIEVDPRGIPIYALSAIYYLKTFAKARFKIDILFADYHSKIVERPWPLETAEEGIKTVRDHWIQLFKQNRLRVSLHNASDIITEDTYQEIFRDISIIKNKLKYLPKEFREFYERVDRVPYGEWEYVNLEITDVLYFNPTIFFSDLPERPLHIALHEKTKQEEMKIPISFLSPTIPPVTANMPAPTFYWITDFTGRDKNIITFNDTEEEIKRKIRGYFNLFENNFRSILYIWLYVALPYGSKHEKITISGEEYDREDFKRGYLERKFDLKDIENSLTTSIIDIIDEYGGIE